MATSVVPISALSTPQFLRTADRSQLVHLREYNRALYRQLIRRLVLEYNRVDLLAELILGYEVKPLHLAVIQHQFRHRFNMVQMFRGSGKSTIGTVVKCIHFLACDPNLRILIGSKTITNAEGFLKEIRGHMEKNEELGDLFGPFYDSRKTRADGRKWETSEIEVLGKITITKEASITCVGVDSTIVSKHYDVFQSDDLLDENNTRTAHMRKKTRTWYHKTYMPCLEPPDEKVPFRGQHNMLGTRFHYEDLYGELEEGRLAGKILKVPALDKRGRSPWHEKFPPKFFRELELEQGAIVFGTQYGLSVEAMRGEIFEYDDCIMVTEEDLPVPLSQMATYTGVDLAIAVKKKRGQKKPDLFAIVDIAVYHDIIVIVDHFTARLKFSGQTAMIMEHVETWKPSCVGVETTNYQAAQAQILEEKDLETRDIGDPDLNIMAIDEKLDKETRAWQLEPLFKNHRVYYLAKCAPVIAQIVGMPNAAHDDLFDAFDRAVKASRMKKKKKRKKRENEPGVL